VKQSRIGYVLVALAALVAGSLATPVVSQAAGTLMTIVDSTTSVQARVTQGSLYVQERPDFSKLYRTDPYGLSAATQIGDWKYRFSTQSQTSAVALTDVTFANTGTQPAQVKLAIGRRTAGTATCSSQPLTSFLISSTRVLVVPPGETLVLDWAHSPYVSSTPATGHIICVGYGVFASVATPVEATQVSFGAAGYRTP